MKSNPTSKPVANAQRQVAALHDLLTAEQAAPRLNMTPEDLMEKARKKKIPSCNYGPKTVRSHLPSIIASGLRANGVSLEIIAASFGQAGDRRDAGPR